MPKLFSIVADSGRSISTYSSDDHASPGEIYIISNQIESLTRLSTGKILYDNFNDGDLTGWNIEEGSPLVENYKVKLVNTSTIGSRISHTITDTLFPIYITMKVTPIQSSSSHRLMLIVDDITTNYYAFEQPDGQGFKFFKKVNGVVTNPVATGEEVFNVDSNEHDYTFKVEADGNITVTRDGITVLSVVDTSHNHVLEIHLLGNDPFTNTAGPGAYFDDISVSSDYRIRCQNMPAGYKLRVANKVAVESGGIAVLDCSGLMFPQDLVEVLDANDNVVKIASLPGDVYGNDLYSY